MMLLKLVLIVLAYLIGSVSSAVWIGKRFYRTDIRQQGSGNAGFTNTVRVLGWRAGIPVFIIDITKGVVAVMLVYLIPDIAPKSEAFINTQLVLGTAALVGHIFPLYFGFKGGKGVATLLGVMLAVQPQPTLICLGIFIIVLLSSGYVSLGSVIAGMTFPILIIVVFKTDFTSLVVFSLLISILLILTHQKNIERLIKREESRAHIFRKRDK
jgi:glycerol-3-phosphate acyltransferase PlsY